MITMEKLKILPPQLQFDPFIAENFETTSENLRLNYEYSEDLYKKSHDANNQHLLEQYTYALSSLLDVRENQVAEQAIERALYLAFDIGILLMPRGETVRADIFEPINKKMTAVEASEYIKASSQAYLQQRPALNSLLDQLMPEIDPSGRYGYQAQTVAAYTTLYIELNNSDRFIDQEVETLGKAIDEHQNI